MSNSLFKVKSLIFMLILSFVILLIGNNVFAFPSECDKTLDNSAFDCGTCHDSTGKNPAPSENNARGCFVGANSGGSNQSKGRNNNNDNNNSNSNNNNNNNND